MTECQRRVARKLNGLTEGDGREELKRTFRIANAVERQGGLVLRESLAVGVFGILLLQIAAVFKDQLGHIARGLGCEDAAAKAVAHQLRQIAGMVEMGMGQHDGVDAGGLDRQGLPIQLAQVLEALEQATVDQDALSIMSQEMFRASDGAGTAQRGQRKHGGLQIAGWKRSAGLPLLSTAARSAGVSKSSRDQPASGVAASIR